MNYEREVDALLAAAQPVPPSFPAVLLTRIPLPPAVCDPEAARNVGRSSSEAHDDKSRADTKVEKVHLEWQQLCCTYNTAGGKIVVLHDVWGQAAPGEMQVSQVIHQQVSAAESRAAARTRGPVAA
jgi:hypothetical protein